MVASSQHTSTTALAWTSEGQRIVIRRVRRVRIRQPSHTAPANRRLAPILAKISNGLVVVATTCDSPLFPAGCRTNASRYTVNSIVTGSSNDDQASRIV